MIGDDHGTKDFSEIWYRELSLREGQLVYNTGRSLSSYVQVQKEKSLPQPTALITAVGSEIYWISAGNEVVLDEEWAQSLRNNGWNRETVVSVRFPIRKENSTTDQSSSFTKCQSPNQPI